MEGCDKMTKCMICGIEMNDLIPKELKENFTVNKYSERCFVIGTGENLLSIHYCIKCEPIFISSVKKALKMNLEEIEFTTISSKPKTDELLTKEAKP